MNRTLLSAFALALAAPLAAAQDVASLGSVKMSADEVKRLATLAPGGMTDDALEALVRQELVRRALLEEAKAHQWDLRPEVAERASLASEDVVASSWLDSVATLPAGYPAEADIRALYEKNRAYLRMPKRYHLSQIFIRRPAKAEDVAAAEKRAADLAKRAASGSDFAGLARKESEDAPTRDKGGDLGWVPEAALLPEVRAAVGSLKPGETSGLIAAGGGWHVVRLAEVKEPDAATYEEAKPSLIQALRRTKLAELRKAHIDALIAKTPPVIDRARLSALHGAPAK